MSHKRILVYCGALPGTTARFAEAAERLADGMIARDLGLVYGGGGIGLMGVVARRMCAAGAEVIGVIPRFLQRTEAADTQGLDSSLVHEVHDMHTRKSRMLEICDAVLALPGGFGTLDELFEAITWKQIGLHDKPMGILNLDGYYNAIEEHIAVMLGHGFITTETASLVHIEHDVDILLDKLTSYTDA